MQQNHAKGFVLQYDTLDQFHRINRNGIKNALHKYNKYQPHAGLKGSTPMKYIHQHNFDANRLISVQFILAFINDLC